MTTAHQPAPTERQREAARTVSYLVATRQAATDELLAHGADTLTLTALRATSEAIGAGRTSWDDLPANSWVGLTGCLIALASSEHLTPGEREDAAVLALHYRPRTAGADRQLSEQLHRAWAQAAREALSLLDEVLAGDPDWQAARGQA